MCPYSHYFLVFVCVLACAGLSSCTNAQPEYTVIATRINLGAPLLSSLQAQSAFDYNYNPSYIPLFRGTDDTQPTQDALLVRCQNRESSTDPFAVGPSQIALVNRTGPLRLDEFNFEYLSDGDVVLKPSSQADAYGCEDPRVVYRTSTRTYYLLYSAVQQYPSNVTSRLAMATSSDGVHWTKQGPLFPHITWSKSGALLIRDDEPGPSLLFWGDSTLVNGLEVAVAMDESLLRWKNVPRVWLPVRADHFDSKLVEAGPEPLRLSDGNYLMIYNSARCCVNSTKPGYDYQYNAGFVVLDGADPTRILQRSSVPLLSPETAWEIGESPGQLGLTPNVVFIEGWQRYSSSSSSSSSTTGVDQFIAYYGAADSVVGVALITVSYHTI